VRYGITRLHRASVGEAAGPIRVCGYDTAAIEAYDIGPCVTGGTRTVGGHSIRTTPGAVTVLRLRRRPVTRSPMSVAPLEASQRTGRYVTELVNAGVMRRCGRPQARLAGQWADVTSLANHETTSPVAAATAAVATGP
jgi:hypothetical protein